MATVTIPPAEVNWRNVLLKGVWTVASVALSYALVVLAGIDAWWVMPISGGVNWALAAVRERLGSTTPDLPPAGVLGQLEART